jgi:hypothetical protein
VGHEGKIKGKGIIGLREARDKHTFQTLLLQLKNWRDRISIFKVRHGIRTTHDEQIMLLFDAIKKLMEPPKMNCPAAELRGIWNTEYSSQKSEFF